MLSSVVARSPDAATLEAALTQAVTIGSDHEAGTFLHEVLKQSGVEGPMRGPFFKVVSGMSSGYEKGRILQAVIKKPDVRRYSNKSAMSQHSGTSCPSAVA